MGLVWDMLLLPLLLLPPLWFMLLLSLLSMLPPLWLLPPLLFTLLPPSLLPITATPRFPPLLPSPLLVPPLLLSPPSEGSMPELAGMSPTPPVLSMLPRGRLRLIPMSSDTTDWDMVPMDTLLPSLLSMLPPLWLLPPLLFMLLPPSLLPITATPRSPPLLPSPPLCRPCCCPRH